MDECQDGDRRERVYTPHAMTSTTVNEQELARRVDQLVDENRARALRFLRPDWYPSTREERIRALEHTERRADRETFRRAAELRRWLSQTSSAPSAGS